MIATPVSAVHTGETPAAVVDGFTITNVGFDYFHNAIRCLSSPTIKNCVITKSYANYQGGGIYVSGSSAAPIIEDCTISNNEQGIVCRGSSPMIINCLVSENGGDYTGGIACYDGATPTIIGCLIRNNAAFSSGGGLYISNSSPTLVNCTIVDNEGSGSQETAFVSDRSTSTFINCTLTSPFHLDESFPTFTNSIVWADIPGQSMALSTFNHCDVFGGATGEGNIDADPLFVDPDNGDYHLGPGSPCIDTGDPWILDACLPPGQATERSDMGAYGGADNCGW